MKLQNIILSEVSHAQAKSYKFFLIWDYRPKTNATILWDMGHTKGRLYKGGIGQEKETKSLRVVDVLTV
jgi:hypothetical protein